MASKELNYERALHLSRQWCDDCKINATPMGAEICCNVCRNKYAIEALEKQIPKKPKDGTIAGYCPECGDVVFASENYCPNCGKALDWSEV